MYRIWLTNFGYYANCAPSPTLEAARRQAERIGFECAIHAGGRVVGFYSPIGGFRSLV